MTITVVAALIQYDGKLLVCQRRRGNSFELLWEFPGGKVEEGESPEGALARELREELAVEAQIGPELYRTVHHYAETSQTIELIFFTASLPAEFTASLPAEFTASLEGSCATGSADRSADAPKIKNLVFEQFQWRDPAALLDLDFLPADHELIEKLADGTIGLPG